jgi:hypothetical protein
VRQSGESARSGKLSKSGSRLLRRTAVEAAQNAWRPTTPWNRLYLDVKRRSGKSNAAKAAVARKLLIAVWHVLQRQEPLKPARPSAGSGSCPGKLPLPAGRLTTLYGIEKPGQLQATRGARQGRKRCEQPTTQRLKGGTTERPRR